MFKLVIAFVLVLAVAQIWADEACEDKDEHCKDWVPRDCATGWYVKENCKKSCNLCGVCEDTASWCAKFKDRCGGKDENVNNFCKKTCGTCGGGGGDNTDAPPEPTEQPGPEPGPEPTGPPPPPKK